MERMNPPKNWVIRYWLLERPATQHSFAGWKEDEESPDAINPSYAFKFDNIMKYETAKEAFEDLVKLTETGLYGAEVKRICLALNEEYYFI
jgi:hypothetical protein